MQIEKRLAFLCNEEEENVKEMNAHGNFSTNKIKLNPLIKLRIIS